VSQRDRSDWDGNAAGVDDCVSVESARREVGSGKLKLTFQMS
jgi:hypothetical protein